jgi:uncharacterized protein (DUF433 family)
MATQSFKIVGRGIYSLRDAARLTSIPARRIRRWLEGYEFRARTGARHSDAVLHHDYEAVERRLWLSFADLVEVRFVDAFLKTGVSWAAIRVAAERACELLKQDHPFSSRQFKTDGHTIMTDIAEGTRAPELLDLVKNQVALKRVLDPYLYRGLDFGPTNHVTRWWHEAGRRKIVIDPARAFGKPIVANEGVPTRILFDAFLVERSIDRTAQLFEVSKSSANAAVEFEKRLAA